jgi:hypothetical protein
MLDEYLQQNALVVGGLKYCGISRNACIAFCCDVKAPPHLEMRGI